MEWSQVLTILAGNMGLFLWAKRQARSDFLHLDKKMDEHRKETQSILKECQNMVREIREENREFYTKMTFKGQ